MIRDLTKENERLENEKEVFKNLYNEEKIKKNKTTSPNANPKYFDYDNLTDDDAEGDEDIDLSGKQNKPNKEKQNGTEKKKSNTKDCHESFQCDQCEYKTKNKNALEKHKMIAMGHKHTEPIKRKTTFQCDLCDLSFGNKFDKETHETTMHNPGSTKLPCTSCDFVAKSEDILQKHMKVAMGHKRQINCRYFFAGNCRRGRFCKYLHPTRNENNLQDNSLSNEKKRRKNTSNKLCKYTDQCFKFPNCGFSHYEICKFQQNCLKGQSCRFVHLQNTHFLDFWPQNGVAQ